MRDIYLLRSGEYMPLLISLPPTSIKPFKEFLNRAFVYRRRATYGSLIQIGLKKENNGSNDYSVATFRLCATSRARNWLRSAPMPMALRSRLRLSTSSGP